MDNALSALQHGAVLKELYDFRNAMMSELNMIKQILRLHCQISIKSLYSCGIKSNESEPQTSKGYECSNVKDPIQVLVYQDNSQVVKESCDESPKKSLDNSVKMSVDSYEPTTSTTSVEKDTNVTSQFTIPEKIREDELAIADETDLSEIKTDSRINVLTTSAKQAADFIEDRTGMKAVPSASDCHKLQNRPDLNEARILSENDDALCMPQNNPDTSQHKQPKKFNQCPYCKRCFESEYHSKDNIVQAQLDTKLHVCKVCKKAFGVKNRLIEHERIHTGERHFKCKKCLKSFAFKVNLIRHSKIHTVVKPFQCHVCSKHFTRGSTLRKHLNIHIQQISFE